MKFIIYLYYFRIKLIKRSHRNKMYQKEMNVHDITYIY